MTTRYCRPCGAELGFLNDVHSSDVLGTTYQLTKFMKHTVPRAFLDSVSVFETASTGRYADYVVDTAACGTVEIDDRNRRNLIWLAGDRTGFRYKGRILQGPADGVKVVLSSESGKIHAFPVLASDLVTERCAKCGGPVTT